MDYRTAFKVVSTGKRVSSLYAEPKLTVYPDTNRMRLTRKALEAIQVEGGDRLMVLQSDAILAFIKDDEGKCKVDNNGNFTSSAVVTPLKLDENTDFGSFEILTAEAIGIDEDYEPETPVILFDLSSAVKAEEETEEEDNE